MKADRAYSAMARFYEKLSEDCDYEKWSQYVCSEVGKYAPNGSGADFACGSGFFTRALASRGFDVFGTDISVEMLGAAKTESVKRGIPCDYLLGDIRTFRGFKKLGFITAINDAVNYIAPDELTKAFKNVRFNLVTGGVFMFDISSEYKLRNVIADNVFSEDLDDVTYIWFNTLYCDRVEMDLTFFIPDGNGKYTRQDERHTQFIHKRSDVEQALSDAGFDTISVTGHLGEKPGSDSERFVFIAKRIK